MQFIPDKYIKLELDHYTLYHSRNEKTSNIKFIKQCFDKALEKISIIYRLPEYYVLLLCVFHDTDNSFSVLNIKLSETALLVPFADRSSAIISCFSPAASPRNGEKTRMIRHLIHELTHIILTIETDSKRKLGDKAKYLKVPVWFDEGLAEYTAFYAMNNQKMITQAKRYYEDNTSDLGNGSFTSFLAGDQINKVDEYKYASGKVAKLIEGKEYCLKEIVAAKPWILV